MTSPQDNESGHKDINNINPTEGNINPTVGINKNINPTEGNKVIDLIGQTEAIGMTVVPGHKVTSQAEAESHINQDEIERLSTQIKNDEKKLALIRLKKMPITPKEKRGSKREATEEDLIR